MSNVKCARCNENLVTHIDVTNAPCLCDACSTTVFGIKGVDYDANESNVLCELAWGCGQNCRECVCEDVK